MHKIIDINLFSPKMIQRLDLLHKANIAVKRKNEKWIAKINEIIEKQDIWKFTVHILSFNAIEI